LSKDAALAGVRLAAADNMLALSMPGEAALRVVSSISSSSAKRPTALCSGAPSTASAASGLRWASSMT